MERDIYQKQYDFELEQRNSIASAANIPIVALTILGGALSTMIVDFKYSYGIFTYIFALISALALIAMIFSLTFVFKSFLGFSYQKIPTAPALAQHYKALKVWHKEAGENDEDSTRLAKADFDEYFNSRLSKAAENNNVNNVKRGNFLHDATLSIAVALAFLASASPFYIYRKINSETVIHQVEIVKPLKLEEKLNMSNKNGDNGSSATQQAVPATTPAAAPASVKPSGPPNIVFKGSVETGNIAVASQPINNKIDSKQ